MAIDVARLRDQRGSSGSQFFAIDVTGLDETLKKLAQFANDFTYTQTSKNVMVPAARAAMKPVATTLKAFAPRAPEIGRRRPADPRLQKHMADTVSSTARVPSAKDKRSLYLTQNEDVLGEASIATEGSRALAQEFGAKSSIRRQGGTRAQPFLRRALRYTAPAILDIFATKVSQLIDRQYRKSPK